MFEKIDLYNFVTTRKSYIFWKQISMFVFDLVLMHCVLFFTRMQKENEESVKRM